MSLVSERMAKTNLHKLRQIIGDCMLAAAPAKPGQLRKDSQLGQQSEPKPELQEAHVHSRWMMP